ADRHRAAVRRAGPAPAAAARLAAGAMAAPASARVVAAGATGRAVGAGGGRRVVLELRCLGPARAGVAALERVRRPPPCRARRLCLRGRTGRAPRRMVVAALALRRTGQAAGAAAVAVAAGPDVGHGHAGARHRRRGRAVAAVAAVLPARGRRARPVRTAGRGGGAAEVALVSGATGTLPVSGVVIARDEGDRIGRCVASLAALCREVIVLDSGSRDDTVAVATAAGARVEQQDWLGFAAQKNAAIARATQPWVLLLDADEWLGADAAQRLRALFADGAVERADAWRLPRRTHYLGTALDHGGWGREWVERLL